MRAHLRVPSTPGATAPDVDIRQHGDAVLRSISVLGAIAGVALVTDVVIITIINSSFDPLDSILFFIGFIAMLLTLVALAIHLSAGHEGRARAGLAVLAFLGIFLVLGAISLAFDTAGRHLFSPANIGLHDEWSFFSVGVCLLVLAGWATRRQHAHPSTEA